MCSIKCFHECQSLFNHLILMLFYITWCNHVHKVVTSKRIQYPWIVFCKQQQLPFVLSLFLMSCGYQGDREGFKVSCGWLFCSLVILFDCWGVYKFYNSLYFSGLVYRGSQSIGLCFCVLHHLPYGPTQLLALVSVILGIDVMNPVHGMIW